MKSRDVKQLACGHTACYSQTGDQNLAPQPLGQLFPLLGATIGSAMLVEYNLSYNTPTRTCLSVSKHHFPGIAVGGPVVQWREGQCQSFCSLNSLMGAPGQVTPPPRIPFSLLWNKSSYFKSPSSYTNLNLLLNGTMFQECLLVKDVL